MNPLLTVPGAVADEGRDEGVAAHYGDPLAEQRAADRSAAVVDRSNRQLLAVTGPERLSWLHSLLTQHVTELAEGAGTEALVLDMNGRVEHHAVLAHVGDTVWLDVEPGTAEALRDYLVKMQFWSEVEVRDATGELAQLAVVGPDAARVLTTSGVPVPEGAYAVAALPGGTGFVRHMPTRGGVDLFVPRPELAEWWRKLRDAGAAQAGAMAFEALRVAARSPRLGVDTDERTIPHEVGWIDTAVHLTKGCYRGQETVARVANVGRPPRRLVLLHTSSGDDEPLAPGDPVLLDGKEIGRVGTAVLHHELGGVALALVKRSIPVEAELVAGDAERATPVRIDPDSMPPGEDVEPAGRAAQQRLRSLRMA
ncbi:folate-binding protein YgfZ [Pseudonocardia eucalypti]|uniref:Folate-binding protein YgfZ n=1 Tax=Pseudonocardia eucalypti TaxID=648755 RepID=A0ABP9R2J8_9PSEU|nr:folate-binding protein YgfZ [Pseudonocardia eucalypti]